MTRTEFIQKCAMRLFVERHCAVSPEFAMEEAARLANALFEDMPTQRPTYNHTRSDGPFAPCAECMRLMTREELIAALTDALSVLDQPVKEPDDV